MDVENFFSASEGELEDLGGGLSRKVRAYNDNLMRVEVHFESGTVAPVHNHPHEQITYLVSGRFQFEIDGVKKGLDPGIRPTSSQTSRTAPSASKPVC